MQLDASDIVEDTMEQRTVLHLQFEIERLEREIEHKNEVISMMADSRDAYVRAFNRLEAAITHHKRDEGFPDVHDESLYVARARILSALHNAR